MKSILEALLEDQGDYVLTFEAIQEQCKKFHEGDLVKIPASYLDSKEDVVVTVDFVCTHHIVFRFRNGIKKSFIKFDCMKFELVKSSNLTDFQTV